MTVTETTTADLVAAAQRGDRQSLDRLVAEHLPLVYNIAAGALDDPADVDDVVQNTMLRAVRDLRSLRTPGSFRPWLAAIAVRQVGTHQQQAARDRTASLDEATGRPDPDADIEGVTALRAHLTGQRREVAEATRWLDAGDRTVLALWWQEVGGLISRAELADAAGLSIAHAAVRVQRMRAELDAARGIVAALAAHPTCPRLAETITGWDGRPSPLWRKRIARHVRSCPACAAAAGARVPAERLLNSLPALAVPAGLLEATLVKTAAGVAGTAAATGVTAAIAAHPIAAAVASLTVAAAIAVPVVGTMGSGPAAPAVTAAPATPTVPLGRLSLEWTGGGYLTTSATSDAATVAGVTGAGRRRATFVAVAGLSDPACVSFRTLDGRYLRHYELKAYTHEAAATPIFRQDATYCPQPGAGAGTVMLRSFNYPDFYLRWDGNGLGIGYFQDTAGFRTSSTFRLRPALATG
ncbi:sigma-70 family RNA polymerase sigma factor [Actinoplanes utahensis]|uniref:RNA polymerase sigma factor n=1 Tax=Actinoplanes utahensis TaxID=1869 RepID=A0A0A6UNE3_ACTUT|nr:sigma-70 family RNA polymerase sigma factor [Actinoplanes utahensis]KHD75809.1 hypothetical protein MB27_20405 [Actinoplanes utahensis]GIF32203.1 hypothetical protein Aut01nite_51890 [Actinoplanes utahensis]